MVAGFDLFRPVFVGLVAAAGVVIVTWLAAMIKTGWKAQPLAAIDAGTAWSSSDSWVTNVAAVTSLLTATWTQLGTGSPPLVPSQAGPAIWILFISFAAAAGLAPVIYASCTKHDNIDESKSQGTVAGYLLAAFATLFAVGGEMTALGMFVAEAMPAGPTRGLLISFIFVGAAFVALYSFRTTYTVLTGDIVKDPATLTAGTAKAPRSFMLAPAGRRSATL